MCDVEGTDCVFFIEVSLIFVVLPLISYWKMNEWRNLELFEKCRISLDDVLIMRKSFFKADKSCHWQLDTSKPELKMYVNSQEFQQNIAMYWYFKAKLLTNARIFFTEKDKSLSSFSDQYTWDKYLGLIQRKMARKFIGSLEKN